MKRGMLKRLAAFGLAGALLISPVSVWAAEPESQVTDSGSDIETDTSVEPASEQPEEILEIDLYSRAGGQPGEKGTAYASIYGGAEDIDISGCKLKAIRLNDGSTIVLDVDNAGIETVSNDIEITVPYEIPEDFAGTSLQYKIQLVSKEDESVILAESNESAIYPYTLADGVMKYFDTSQGEKYKMTVETDEHIAEWDIPGGGSGGYSIVENASGGYDYYMDPATTKVSTGQETSLVNSAGIKLSVPTASEDMKTLFDALELYTAEVSDEEQLQKFLKIIGDQNAEVKMYQVEISSVSTEYVPDIRELIGQAYITLPVPEGWDVARVEGYTQDHMTIAGSYQAENGQIVLPVENDDNLNEDSAKIIYTCAIVEHSVATETKDWEQVVEDYILDIRFIDWFGGDELAPHFYKNTPPADDAAVVTVYEGDLNWTENQELFRVEVPYDTFAERAKDFFVNVPDMTEVQMADLVYYDEETDMMCRPMGGGGNAPLVTEVVKANDLGDGRWAIRFKVSNEDLDSGEPDMDDESQYSKCTLTVEDNGKGEWRYVSFEDGYTDGTPKPEEPTEPEEPDTPEPEEPTEPDTPEQPDNDKKPSKEQTDTIVEEIKEAKEGGSVSVDMGSATVLSGEVLKAAKGKDVNIAFQMNGYTWTINGKDITEADLKDIDLEVKTGVHGIPEDVVKKLAGERDTLQITLAHEGAFGFTAELTVYIGEEYDGQYGNLFWYNNDKKMEYIDSDKVKADGCATFTFTHASDYVIVLDDEQMSAEDIPEELRVKQEKDAAPRTGDTTGVWLYVCLLAGAGAVLYKKIKRA